MAAMPTIPAKTILSTYSEWGWFGSNYTMNIYKGCCHGCIYCDSRSACYGVENFDTVRVKENALEVIERDLKSKRKKGIIITGSMSDAYNPFEKELELTRGAIGLIDKYGFGFAVDTKSDLVLRDIDAVKSVQTHSPVAVSFTVTTADDALGQRIEQNVCSSGSRFSAIEKLAGQGIPCGVLLMPILPFINDTVENIMEIVRRAHQSGARWIYAGESFAVTLRQNQRDHFYEKLDRHFPGVKAKYQQQFGFEYWCPSPKNAELWAVFTAECNRLGILYEMDKISGYVKGCCKAGQTSLFPID